MASMLDFLSYAGKRVVVTGGTSGIGQATSAVLADLGAHVFVLGRRAGQQKAGGSPGEGLEYIAVDLGDMASIDRAVAAIGGPVHGLFNCAGASSDNPPVEILTINFAGTRHLTEAMIPLMPSGSAIAIVSSAFASLRVGPNVDRLKPLVETADFAAARHWIEAHAGDFPPSEFGPGSNAYAFSKEAICLYALLKAREVARLGIRINTVGTGSTMTPMYQAFLDRSDAATQAKTKNLSGTVSQPHEQAFILAFLNSSAANSINAADILADGGSYTGMRTDINCVRLPGGSD